MVATGRGWPRRKGRETPRPVRTSYGVKRLADPASDIVIGSGPAGFAAVAALLERGRRVTVIDVGQTLEPDRAALRDELGATEPGDWAPASIQRFRASQRAITDGVARFGSRFAMRPEGDPVASANQTVMLRSSHARGGLSNLWGSAALPWSRDDLKHWPVTADDLRPHYVAVAGLVPVAGRPAAFDALTGVELPLAPEMPPTSQSRELVRRLRPVTSGAGGFWPGASRVAVAPGCRACGLCLFGCPYGLIFSSARPIEAFARDGRLTYLQAEAVRIRETGGSVEIDLADGRPPVAGARVFVGAGVLETARLIFASAPEIAAAGVTLKESRHSFTPLVHRWRAGDVEAGPHHTLSIAFVEFRDQDVSDHLVHAQLYGWNSFYADEMAGNYGRGLAPLTPVFRALSRRLIVAQTFLHSDDCPPIALRAGPGGRLEAEVLARPGFDARMEAARGALSRYLRSAGLHRIPRAGQIALPGSSFHLGGTFGMAARPAGAETDILGRPRGSTRIHIVDASVMPAIPASTITLSVMANAHRIAANS